MPQLRSRPLPSSPRHPPRDPRRHPVHKARPPSQRQGLSGPQQRPRHLSPILQDGRLLATIPQRLVPVEVPKIKGLVSFGAELKGTGTRFFGTWTEWGGTFIGWMRTRPNLAGREQESVYAIGMVLARPVFALEEQHPASMHDAMELFHRALQEAAEDLGSCQDPHPLFCPRPPEL